MQRRQDSESWLSRSNGAGGGGVPDAGAAGAHEAAATHQRQGNNGFRYRFRY